jgi:PAS domain-containing protein
MPNDLYRNPLTEILFEQAPDFVGLYDIEKGWFTNVNPAGYRLLGYASALALYNDPVRTLHAKQLTEQE